MVPEPRTCVLMVPYWMYSVETSGRVIFIIVLEKKVSTNSIAKKIMAKVLTHSRLIFFSPMVSSYGGSVRNPPVS